MTNPYEVNTGNSMVEENDGSVIPDFTVPESTIQRSISDDTIDSTEAANQTEVTQSIERKPLDTRKARVTHYREKRQIMRLPDGEEKTQQLDNWAQSYYGMDYKSYQKWLASRKPTSISGFLAQKSILYNQEVMMSPAVGTVDFATDAANLVPGVNIPKIPEFEQEGATALREISSILIPFLALKGKSMQTGGQVHAAKVAPVWLQRLGNNPVFARFATVGLDLGVGAAVDATVQTNKENDTLATSWKRGRWWGHQVVPEAWTSDGLSSDDKHRANVLEGVRLGFYTDVIIAAAKLLKAGRSVDNVTKYLAEPGNSQKNLDAITKDPLDSKVFDPNDVVSDTLQRSDAKYERDLRSLTTFVLENNEPLTKPTVGIHKIRNELKTGIRTKDFEGIIGAAGRQAQIANNVDSAFGRLGNIITEGIRKSGVQDIAVRNRQIVRSLRDQLVNGGKYSVQLPSGAKLTWKQINNEGTILAEILSDPTLPRGSLNKILENFKETIDGVKRLNPVGFNAVNKASSRLLEDWSDINLQKSTAYFLTSEAGQVSDIAEGARYMRDTDAVGRAHEQILDRLELFDIESSIFDFNFKGRDNLLKSIQADPNNAHKYIKDLDQKFDAKLSDIIPNAKRFRQTLDDIQLNNPEFAEVLRLAYEAADGNVRTIKDLNNYIKNTFGTYSKAIYDGNPEVTSIVHKALMSNVFNSILSAVKTPVKALYGNFGGFISEPVSVMYGALRTGDTVQMRRAAHMYFGLADTLQNGFNYMGLMFRKAATDPGDLSTLFREDLRFDQLKNLEFAKATAEAAAKKGEFGPQALVSIHDELQAIASDPVMRFGPNSMTALDGFTEATQKIAQDKGLAFDELMRRYPDGNWSQKEFQEMWTSYWKKGWDENGVIKQSGVEFARREIALNLNTPLVTRLNPLIKKFPILRSIFMFPTTQMNVLDMFGKYSNFSRVKIGTDFAGDYAELLGPFGTKSINDFIGPGGDLSEVRKVLAKRGIDMTGDPLAKLAHLRNKVRGRVAIGNMAVMGGLIMMSQGRIRGTGHWDSKIQKQRLTQGWVPKTYQGLDGNWHSYEFLGPLGDWLALVANVGDNFNSMNTTTFEKLDKKLAFILGASLTDRSMLSDIEPLFGILSGNENARTRWTGNMTNALFPMAGLRNEIGKNINGMLREVETNDLGEVIRNRNNWLDVVDPENGLGPLINFVTGKPVNQDRGFWGNAMKQTFGWGGEAHPEPESQFLIDIEYDMQPQFNISDGGVPYTSKQKSELKQLLGEDGYFNKRLKDIMARASDMKFTDPNDGTVIKGYVNINRYLRDKGYTSEDFKEYGRIKLMIDIALREAINRVETDVTGYDLIKQQELLKHQAKSAALNQDKERLDRVLNLRNK